jgi:ATP synthase protein I
MFLLSVRRAAILQIALIGLMLLAVGYLEGTGAALAAGYGGMAALCNTALLYWRWSQGLVRIHCDAEQHMKSFYRSSLERFFVVGLWLAVGFAWMRLPPLAMLTGFVVGQLAWLVASPALRERS